jgi:hypothetical protein
MPHAPMPHAPHAPHASMLMSMLYALCSMLYALCSINALLCVPTLTPLTMLQLYTTAVPLLCTYTTEQRWM